MTALSSLCLAGVTALVLFPTAAGAQDPEAPCLAVVLPSIQGVDGSATDMAGEIGFDAGISMLAQQMGERRQKKAPPDGWDSVSGLPYGFSGRVGHVRVSVQAQAPDVSRDVMERLAAAVHRIPDLPFKADNPDQVIQLGGGDRNPCELLPRAEAEAVLGPLVVDPYRASGGRPCIRGLRIRVKDVLDRVHASHPALATSERRLIS